MEEIDPVLEFHVLQALVLGHWKHEVNDHKMVDHRLIDLVYLVDSETLGKNHEKGKSR